MNIACYSFGEWADLEVETSDPEARKFYAEEFTGAAAPGVSTASRLRLRWERSPARGASLPGWVRHVHKVLARWDYRASVQGGVPELEARGNTWALPMVHHMLVLPTLRRVAAEAGTLMLHGAAVARGGKSVVFTGRGGAGKTTLTSILLGRGGGWQAMSDDYVFLGPSRRSSGFLTRSHLYQDLLRWAPELAGKLTIAERVQLRLFGWIRRLSGDRLKWPVRVSASRLWPGVDAWAHADLGAFFLLRRTEDLLPAVHRVTDLGAAAVSLLAMNFHEARHHLELMAAAEWAGFDGNWVHRWKEAEAALLRARMAETPCYWLDLPVRPASREAFSSEVEDLILPVFELP
ncbi:MAG: hypothetical protein WD906_07945 [Anaerolineales bacterium]